MKTDGDKLEKLFWTRKWLVGQQKNSSEEKKTKESKIIHVFPKKAKVFFLLKWRSVIHSKLNFCFDWHSRCYVMHKPSGSFCCSSAKSFQIQQQRKKV